MVGVLAQTPKDATRFALNWFRENLCSRRRLITNIYNTYTRGKIKESINTGDQQTQSVSTDSPWTMLKLILGKSALVLVVEYLLVTSTKQIVIKVVPCSTWSTVKYGRRHWNEYIFFSYNHSNVLKWHNICFFEHITHKFHMLLKKRISKICITCLNTCRHYRLALIHFIVFLLVVFVLLACSHICLPSSHWT